MSEPRGIVIVTGVSGAGKSTALRALEDCGYYCVDNLPLPLIAAFVELLAARPTTIRRRWASTRARASS